MKLITAIVFLLVSSFQILIAKEDKITYEIKGSVVDENGEAIMSASIQNLESKKGTVTNLDGSFLFVVNKEQVTISVSALGYVAKKVQVQSNPEDSVKITLHQDQIIIDQVVCTGTIKPTPIDSSIYKVKLISSERIEQSGAMNLGELLTTEANIRMSTDLILGTQIEMSGLSGQNVKIMIDGIPVIGRLDGNVDLSQINLDNIAQVEVVEGPMSVVYGNNALAGTINLITKTNKYHNLQAEIKGYTESVSRYSSNGNISVKHGNHTVSADGGYEYFGGVDFDDATRSMDWKPKTLYRSNLGYNFKKNNWNPHIKAGYYSDELKYKNDLQDIYKAFDTYYFTQRFDVSGGLAGTWKDNCLDILASYNYYDRSEQDIYTDMRTLESTEDEKISSQAATQKMLRAIYGYSLSSKLSVQTGIDFNVETMTGPRIIDEKQDIGDFAGFVNVHYSPIKSFEIQPGLRYAYNTDYNAPLVYSLNMKWNLMEGLLWRASVAKGYRAPNIKELYYEFIDSNHEIYGNSELNAESSNNFNSTIEYAIEKNDHRWNLSASTYYNDIEQMITLIQRDGSTAYVYDNIDEYKTRGSNVDLTYKYKYKLQIRTGYGITGRYNSYTTENTGSKYNTTHDWFAGLKFTDPLINLKWSLDYKYNGELPFFYTDEENNTVKEGFQDAYQTLNASVSRTFVRQWNITAGAKNIFNVTSVNQNSSNTAGAHSGSSETPISYGRSYFLSIGYKLYK